MEKSPSSISEGNGGFDASLPIDQIGQVLLSPDATILLMNGSPQAIVLDLVSGEVNPLGDLDGRLLTFTPDSQGFLTRFAGSSQGELLTYYSLVDGSARPLTRLKYPSERFDNDHFAFLPDPQLFSGVFDGKYIKVWNLENGELIFDLDLSAKTDHRVTEFGFSSDSSKLVLNMGGAESAQVEVYDLRTGASLFTVPGRNGIHLFPADNLLLTYEVPGANIRKVWDLDAATLLGEIELYQEAQNKEALIGHPLFEQLSDENAEALRRMLNFSPDPDTKQAPQLSLSKSDRNIIIRGSQPSRVSLAGHTGEVRIAEFILNQSLIVSFADDYTVRFWGVPENRLSDMLTGHQAVIRKVIFSPDGSLLASVDAGGMLWLWDTQTRTPLRHWQVLSSGSQDTVRLDFSADGTMLLVAPFDGSELSVWDVNTQQAVFTISPEKSGFYDAMLAPDGDLLVASEEGSSSGEFEWVVHSLRDQTILARFEDKAGFLRGTFTLISDLSPDGAIMAEFSLENMNQAQVNIVDLSDGNRKVSIPLTSAGGLLFSTDGTWLTDGVVAWSTADWHPELEFPVIPGEIRIPIRFSSSGELLASFSIPTHEMDNPSISVVVNALPDGREVKRIPLAFHPSLSERIILEFDISPDLSLIANPAGERIHLIAIPDE